MAIATPRVSSGDRETPARCGGLSVEACPVPDARGAVATAIAWIAQEDRCVTAPSGRQHGYIGRSGSCVPNRPDSDDRIQDETPAGCSRGLVLRRHAAP